MGQVVISSVGINSANFLKVSAADVNLEDRISSNSFVDSLLSSTKVDCD